MPLPDPVTLNPDLLVMVAPDGSKFQVLDQNGNVDTVATDQQYFPYCEQILAEQE